MDPGGDAKQKYGHTFASHPPPFPWGLAGDPYNMISISSFLSFVIERQSKEEMVIYRTLQGSVLDPVDLLIYINELHNNVSYSSG